MILATTDSCINSLFEILQQSSLTHEDPRKKELNQLFHKIVFDWNLIEDVDFSILSIETMLELLSYVNEFADEYLEEDNVFSEILNAIKSSKRSCTKKRLL